MSLGYCSFCEITYCGDRDCPLCEANVKINDVLQENEILRNRLDTAGVDDCPSCNGKDKHCPRCR